MPVTATLPADDTYPLIVRVRSYGGLSQGTLSPPVAARRAGKYFVTRQEVWLGLWHSPRNVVVLS